MPKCSTSDLFLPCGWCFSGCEALPAPLIAVGTLPLGPHRHCCVEALWFLISPPRQPVCWTVTSPPGPHCVDDFCWHLTGLQVGSQNWQKEAGGSAARGKQPAASSAETSLSCSVFLVYAEKELPEQPSSVPGVERDSFLRCPLLLGGLKPTRRKVSLSLQFWLVAVQGWPLERLRNQVLSGRCSHAVPLLLCDPKKLSQDWQHTQPIFHLPEGSLK